MGDCINMEDYINMNNNKINSPNDIYKLFRTEFCKKLIILEKLSGFCLLIILIVPAVLLYFFESKKYHNFFLFTILFILQFVIEIVFNIITNNKKIKEKAEKTIIEIFKENIIELNYNTISLIQYKTEQLYNPFFLKKELFLSYKGTFNYLIGLITGIFSTIIASIIKDEVYTKNFYKNLETLIITFSNLSFFIINIFFCFYCIYSVIVSFLANPFLKKIYTETLNDISFKLKLEEYNKINEEKVKKPENNLNKIKVKINFKKRKKIDNDSTLNNPIKQKISYFYYQKQNRLNNKNR